MTPIAHEDPLLSPLSVPNGMLPVNRLVLKPAALERIRTDVTRNG